MPITVPVIVLSDSRTMFKNTIHVPLDATAASDEQICSGRTKLTELLADAETLGQLRRLFIAIGTHWETTTAGY